MGAIVGFLHMLDVFRARLDRPGLAYNKTVWQGIWTWFLWTLFGAYVLTFWILGAVLLGVSKLMNGTRETP
ncbi:hypothetical protein [Leisingera sp. M523]|uniref:hypothetical protein n=1 Tax=Leisingera sp. M523 TaxID=2867013 RepID=UPI0021A3F863|nr:hypothetical protein [Leisingera sp. M523]UWQ27827.1 hypothetical protein K3557_13670 [Leisingera sp. M523]